MPNSVLSDKDLKDYWIKKYYTELATKPELLPKWARAYHFKYHQNTDNSSSSSESEAEEGVEVSDKETNDHQNSESSYVSFEEDI